MEVCLALQRHAGCGGDIHIITPNLGFFKVCFTLEHFIEDVGHSLHCSWLLNQMKYCVDGTQIRLQNIKFKCISALGIFCE